MKTDLTKTVGIFFIIILLIFNVNIVVAQNIADQAKSYLPDFSGQNFGLVILIFIGFIVLMILIGIGTFLFVKWLKFNKEITILEDVAGSNDLEPVGKDKAMLVKVGKGGTELLYLRKKKVYRGSYGKRMGKNKYYFAIGDDGYWYNVTLGSLTDGMNRIKIKPTSVNMRYQNESLMELIKERYDKPGWWAQYGQILVNLIFFMLIALMFWLYFDSFKEAAPTLIQGAEALKEAAQSLKEVVGGLDSLKASGGFING